MDFDLTLELLSNSAHNQGQFTLFYDWKKNYSVVQIRYMADEKMNLKCKQKLLDN